MNLIQRIAPSNGLLYPWISSGTWPVFAAQGNDNGSIFIFPAGMTEKCDKNIKNAWKSCLIKLEKPKSHRVFRRWQFDCIFVSKTQYLVHWWRRYRSHNSKNLRFLAWINGFSQVTSSLNNSGRGLRFLPFSSIWTNYIDISRNYVAMRSIPIRRLGNYLPYHSFTTFGVRLRLKPPLPSLSFCCLFLSSVESIAGAHCLEVSLPSLMKPSRRCKR